MIKNLLLNIDDTFGYELNSSLPKNWQYYAESYLEKLSFEFDYLYSSALSVFTPSIFKNAKIERLYPKDSGITICTIKIRPDKKLVFKLGGYVNKFKIDEFPGLRLGAFDRNLQDYDYSYNDSILYMGNGSISYKFDNDISIETSGYYWLAESDTLVNMGPDDSTYKDPEREFSRSGATLTIKQPDNPFNLQWLVAYSFSRIDMLSAKSDLMLNGLLVQSDEKEAYHGFSREINSVYSQLKWGIFNRTIFLILGGRLDHYSDFGNQYSPRGGIIFLPTEKSSIKALYGRAFRANSLLERYGVAYLIKENSEFFHLCSQFAKVFQS